VSKIKNRLILVSLSLFLIVTLINTPAFASVKKIHLFPVVSIDTETKHGANYSTLLREKLFKSQVFNITDVQGFDFRLNSNDDIISKLRIEVTKKAARENAESVIFGYIIKRKQWFEIKIVLFSIIDDNIVSTFTDRVFIEEEFENSAKRCAIEFASRVSSIKGSKIFFSSAFCPGLGHFLMKKYVKSAMIFGSFAYLFYRQVTLGKITEITTDRFRAHTSSMWISDLQSIVITEYYVDGVLVGEEEYNEHYEAWQREVEPLRQRNIKIKEDRKKFQLGLAAVYLINILDTIFSSKDYEIKRRLEEKVTFDVNPWGRQPSINFNYHF
jgi:hypothetical protein